MHTMQYAVNLRGGFNLLYEVKNAFKVNNGLIVMISRFNSDLTDSE